MNNTRHKGKSDGLVYYMHDESEALRFELAGDLSHDTAPDLEQARQTASSIIGRRPLIVDLTDLTSIDAAGRELLEQWHTLGAQLTVVSSEAKARFQLAGAPISIVGSGPRASKWLPFRAATLWQGVRRRYFGKCHNGGASSQSVTSNPNRPRSPFEAV